MMVMVKASINAVAVTVRSPQMERWVSKTRGLIVVNPWQRDVRKRENGSQLR